MWVLISRCPPHTFLHLSSISQPCLHKHIDARGHKQQCLQAPLSNTGLFHCTAQKLQVLDTVWVREAVWRELFLLLFPLYGFIHISRTSGERWRAGLLL